MFLYERGFLIMVKKTITYTDYNGVERTEEFIFNLSEAELLEMEMSTTGGLSAALKRIVDANDTASLIREFKNILFKAYGEKSADGKRFVKSKAISEAFSQTEAYSKLFMELATDAEAATTFVNGLIPNKRNVALADTTDHRR